MHIRRLLKGYPKFSYSNFHQRFLKGKTLIIFCPKLDTTIEQYIEKLAVVFKQNNIKSITLLHMEVPCCFGVERIVSAALEKSGKNIIIKEYTMQDIRTTFTVIHLTAMTTPRARLKTRQVLIWRGG